VVFSRVNLIFLPYATSVHNQVEMKTVPQEESYRQEQTEEHAQNEEGWI